MLYLLQRKYQKIDFVDHISIVIQILLVSFLSVGIKDVDIVEVEVVLFGGIHVNIIGVDAVNGEQCCCGGVENCIKTG